MKDRLQLRIMIGKVLSFGLMLLLMFASSVNAASVTGGEDVNPNETEVPFSIEERTTPSQDSENWALSVSLDEDAHENGTTLSITTQICLNNGVCDPPVNQEAVLSDDGRMYSASLTPPADHTYVNWRVQAAYSNDTTENFPQGDWYKTWSTCYYDDGAYGGIHADGDGCNVPKSSGTESEGFLPAAGLVFVVGTLGLAVASRRNGQF